MGTVHANPATPGSPAATPPADAASTSTSPSTSTSTPPPVPAARSRPAGGHCGNCGFEDTGHYCSRCGEPLHGTKDTVLQIVWSDMVEGPVHNGFALLKTTWLILARPRRFFDGVLRRQHGMTHVPFFMAPVWRRVSHKPHGVPNAVKYFVLIYTLTFLGAWMMGVDVLPTIPIPFRGKGATLPGPFAEPLMLLFVVCAAWMYSKSLSLLLGGKIETEALTKFMLYLNGFALIPFVGMTVVRDRSLWASLALTAFWLYALFVLPQMALPRIFAISRWRLGFAQAGALVANVVLVLLMVIFAGLVADVFSPGWSVATNKTAAAASGQPFDPAEAGFSAVRRASTNVFPLDTVATLIARIPSATTPPARHRTTRPRQGAPRAVEAGTAPRPR